MSPFNKVTIDYLTRHDATGDYALYLVEPAGWSDLDARLHKLQDRIYTAVDALLDGQIASDYPDSKGTFVRIKIVFLGQDAPERAVQMIDRLHAYVNESPEHAQAGVSRGLISGLAITHSITG